MAWPNLNDLTLPVGVKVHVVLPVDDGVGGGAPEVAVAGLDEVDLLLGVDHVTLELTAEDRPVDATPRHAWSRDMRKKNKRTYYIAIFKKCPLCSCM